MSKLNLFPKSKWNYTTAAHLLNRAGFGGTPDEIQKLTDMGFEDAVSYLVDYDKIPAELNLDPAWSQIEEDHAEHAAARRQKLLAARKPGETDEQLEERIKRETAMIPESHKIKREAALRSQSDREDLIDWWLNRMAFGPRPLQEKMVLFFHGHFACGGKKCHDAYPRFLQNQLFRDMGMGSWEKMLVAISKDMDMLRSLDNYQNQKAHPNENYARELMELYTMGEGQGYTESDVKESARALTGWEVDFDNMVPVFNPGQHDSGVKTFLGEKGNFGIEDICRIIVSKPPAERFLPMKLWTFFTDQKPSEEILSALASEFRSSGMVIRPMMRLLLSCENFYDPSLIGTQIKSPMQWLVGSTRLLGRQDMPDHKVTQVVQSHLGQILFDPPSVKGWDGGEAWMNTNSVLWRYSLVEDIITSEGPKKQKIDVTKLISPEDMKDSAKLLAALQKRFLQKPLAPDRAAALQNYLDTHKERNSETILCAIRLLMTTPEYQLC